MGLRVGEECKPASAAGGFAPALIAYGRKPVEVILGQGAKLWICSVPGKYVQTKKKSIMASCPLHATPHGKAALARVGKELRPDSHSKETVVSCWDCLAKRAISHMAVAPSAKQSSGGNRRA